MRTKSKKDLDFDTELNFRYDKYGREYTSFSSAEKSLLRSGYTKKPDENFYKNGAGERAFITPLRDAVASRVFEVPNNEDEKPVQIGVKVNRYYSLHRYLVTYPKGFHPITHKQLKLSPVSILRD